VHWSSAEERDTFRPFCPAPAAIPHTATLDLAVFSTLAAGHCVSAATWRPGAMLCSLRGLVSSNLVLC